MTEELVYTLELGVENRADIDEIEELLQEILLDLYDQGEVESIRVIKDSYSHQDDSVAELLDLIGEVDSEEIRSAIDLVREMEESDE